MLISIVEQTNFPSTWEIDMRDEAEPYLIESDDWYEFVHTGAYDDLLVDLEWYMDRHSLRTLPHNLVMSLYEYDGE